METGDAYVKDAYGIRVRVTKPIFKGRTSRICIGHTGTYWDHLPYLDPDQALEIAQTLTEASINARPSQ